MPPRTGRPRNAGHDFVNSQFLEQAHPFAEESSAGDNAHLAPMAEMTQGEQSLEERPYQEQDYAQNYPSTESAMETRPLGEQPFIPDMPVSIMADPRSKAKLKVSLAKLATEAAPGAKLDDDAADLLLYVASDFLSNLANFSCRLANHRGAENLTGQDVALYLEQMHGMHISLERPPPPPPPPEEPEAADVGGEPATRDSPSPQQKREPTPPLAKTRPRRHTNTAPPEAAQEEEDEEDEEEEEEGTEGGDNADEGETDEEKPRESRRLRERAIAAEKQVKQRKRGKVGRPRK